MSSSSRTMAVHPSSAVCVQAASPPLVYIDSLLMPSLQYIRLPPPVVPYVLRISIQAGSLASKSGVLYTNFPLDGSAFDREKYHKKMCVFTLSMGLSTLPIS